MVAWWLGGWVAGTNELALASPFDGPAHPQPDEQAEGKIREAGRRKNVILDDSDREAALAVLACSIYPIPPGPDAMRADTAF